MTNAMNESPSSIDVQRVWMQAVGGLPTPIESQNPLSTDRKSPRTSSEGHLGVEQAI